MNIFDPFYVIIYVQLYSKKMNMIISKTSFIS